MLEESIDAHRPGSHEYKPGRRGCHSSSVPLPVHSTELDYFPMFAACSLAERCVLWCPLMVCSCCCEGDEHNLPGRFLHHPVCPSTPARLPCRWAQRRSQSTQRSAAFAATLSFGLGRDALLQGLPVHRRVESGIARGIAALQRRPVRAPESVVGSVAGLLRPSGPANGVLRVLRRHPQFMLRMLRLAMGVLRVLRQPPAAHAAHAPPGQAHAAVLGILGRPACCACSARRGARCACWVLGRPACWPLGRPACCACSAWRCARCGCWGLGRPACCACWPLGCPACCACCACCGRGLGRHATQVERCHLALPKRPSEETSSRSHRVATTTLCAGQPAARAHRQGVSVRRAQLRQLGPALQLQEHDTGPRARQLPLCAAWCGLARCRDRLCTTFCHQGSRSSRLRSLLVTTARLKRIATFQAPLIHPDQHRKHSTTRCCHAVRRKNAKARQVAPKYVSHGLFSCEQSLNDCF